MATSQPGGAGAPASPALPRVCLIGGTGRSGTTILKLVFARHPEAVAIPEFRFPIDPDGLVDFYHSFRGAWSPYHWSLKLRRLERLLRQVASSSLLAKGLAYLHSRYELYRRLPFNLAPKYGAIEVARFSPRFRALSQELIARLSSVTYPGQWNGSELFEPNLIRCGYPEGGLDLAAALGGFWREVIADICATQGKRLYVDDNTWSILWFDRILELLPEARLVHIYRDPRDVVASFTTMRWAPKRVDDAARWYQALIRRWFAVRARLPAATFLELPLEQLVAERERSLRRVCEFWGIPWHEALLATPLDQAHTGRWKRQFNREEQGTLRRILAAEIQTLGYEMDGDA